MIKIELESRGFPAVRFGLMALAAIIVAAGLVSLFNSATSIQFMQLGEVVGRTGDFDLFDSDELEPTAISTPVVIEGAAPVEVHSTIAAPTEPAGGVETGSDTRGLPGGGGSRTAAQRTTACKRALTLYQQLPPPIRFTSLSGKATGEYTIEGFSPAAEVVALFDFLDTLKQLPSKVSLSYWREGQVRDNTLYKFTFHGRFLDNESEPMASIGEAQATAFFKQVIVRARQGGLDSVTAETPIDVPISPQLTQRRQKIWANGSFRQISGFTESLQQLQPQSALSELLVVPVAGRQVRGDESAQLYAAVDVLVSTPGR